VGLGSQSREAEAAFFKKVGASAQREHHQKKKVDEAFLRGFLF
jgi:hypothetical protein